MFELKKNNSTKGFLFRFISAKTTLKPRKFQTDRTFNCISVGAREAKCRKPLSVLYLSWMKQAVTRWSLSWAKHHTSDIRVKDGEAICFSPLTQAQKTVNDTHTHTFTPTHTVMQYMNTGAHTPTHAEMSHANARHTHIYFPEGERRQRWIARWAVTHPYFFLVRPTHFSKSIPFLYLRCRVLLGEDNMAP